MTDKPVADSEALALPKQDASETKDTLSKKRSHEDEPEAKSTTADSKDEETIPTKRQKNESEEGEKEKEEDKDAKSEETKTEPTPETAASSSEQTEDKEEKSEETLKDNKADEPEKEEPVTEKKEKSEEKTDKTEASVKPLLSAGTTFNGGFGSFAGPSFGTALQPTTGKSIFAESQPKNGEASSKETSVFSTSSIFKGGFSSFSSFAAPASKANPWADTDEKDEEKSKDEGSTSTSISTNGIGSSKDVVDQYAQVSVPLEQKKVETGEEYEESKFSCRAKLYALDITNSSEGWKERGVGPLHVNSVKKEFEDQFENKTKARVVMRADGILKVILNVPLSKSTEVFAGMKSSLASENFVRITAFEEGKPFQYSLRTNNADTAKELYESIKKLLPS
ncbi:uncharacterized protein SAPINGB_P002896 [Magnusiomyces paraingens]|uniref:RanBD1 domain-containing protein n=1 Tax=Magnusiomyces paraingens TaxID=2606893 RepID=A0A5E8BGP3_9ASCO|nr:uncharacterized protein SAPINGB_P002896 [Saprochaete ingens]VVT50836.1 unnamed protein product [Saprochaete ingens]